MSERIITIFGTAAAQPDESAYVLAYKTGTLLAQAGFAIANGGYGGTMLASAKGASEAGGKTIGVTCAAFGRGGANEYIKQEIITATLDERLDALIKLGQGYIVLPGATGTLLELAKVWELKNKGFLSAGKPIILLGKFWSGLAELIATVDAGSRRHISMVEKPEQARDILMNAKISVK